MTPDIAQRLEALHECRGLAAALGGNLALFREGWEFVCPLWGGADSSPYRRAPPDDSWEYLTLDVGNRWDDGILLRRAFHGYGEEEGADSHEDGGEALAA